MGAVLAGIVGAIVPVPTAAVINRAWPLLVADEPADESTRDTDGR